MKNKNILISGAGIAGLTLAYWLQRYGFSPTLIERAPALRTNGYKVDIRGTALDVIKSMGLHSQISDAKTDMRGATVVDHSGHQIAEMSGDAFGLRVSEDLEIMRGDLCQILIENLNDVECIFDDSIKAISQNLHGVNVEFERNQPRHFDLVIGADGLHSIVRHLVFGEESRFAKDLGLYIAIFTVPNYLKLDRWELGYSDSRKLVNLYSSRGDIHAKAAFLFASEPLSFNSRNIAQQQQLLANTYAEVGWEVPRLLGAMIAAPDFYFDSITQICMDAWSKERVVLAGDAGYCASPVSGQGTSLALVGAYVLAGELAAASGDYKIAFVQYEKQLRKYVKENQKLGQLFAKNMTGEKKNKIVVWLHDQFMKIIPGQWINFLTQRSVNRVNKVANSINLKNYSIPSYKG